MGQFVANRELSQELYELSGWEGNGRHLVTHKGKLGMFMGPPMYDLGYLLRKLPKEVNDRQLSVFLYYNETTIGYTEDSIDDCVWWSHQTEAATPEDAACKLCIELFRQGVLKRGDSNE